MIYTINLLDGLLWKLPRCSLRSSLSLGHRQKKDEPSLKTELKPMKQTSKVSIEAPTWLVDVDAVGSNVFLESISDLDLFLFFPNLCVLLNFAAVC